MSKYIKGISMVTELKALGFELTVTLETGIVLPPQVTSVRGPWSASLNVPNLPTEPSYHAGLDL